MDAIGLGCRESERDVFKGMRSGGGGGGQRSGSRSGKRSKANDKLRSILRSSRCKVTELKSVATAIIVSRDQPADKCIIEGVRKSVGGDSEGTRCHNLI